MCLPNILQQGFMQLCNKFHLFNHANYHGVCVYFIINNFNEGIYIVVNCPSWGSTNEDHVRRKVGTRLYPTSIPKQDSWYMYIPLLNIIQWNNHEGFTPLGIVINSNQHILIGPLYIYGSSLAISNAKFCK